MKRTNTYRIPALSSAGAAIGTVLLLLASCSPTKNLPPGETVYKGFDIKYESLDTSAKAQKPILDEELSALVLPKPTPAISIKVPILNKYIIGGPPVYTSSINFEKNRQVLSNRLENKGYFKNKVTFDTTTRKQKTSVVYTVRTGDRYYIDSVSFPKDSSELSKAIRRVTRRSILRRGRGYDLDQIKAERLRIDGRLKQQGYYFFNENYLLDEVDSTIGTRADHKVDMNIIVKPETPPQARAPYRINDVVIYADYSIATDTNFSKSKAVFYDSFWVVDPYKKFHPRMFKRNLRFRPGDLYNRNDHNLTLNRLVSLGVYKFVKARFDAVDTSSAHLLNTFYYLSPANKYSLRAQVSALTKSNNTTGTDFTVTFRNRNTFHSAEQLAISAFVGLETQIAGQQNIATTRYGANIELMIPRVIGPIRSIGRNSEFVPNTRIGLGYEYFRRTSQYTLNSFKFNYGYRWNSSITKEHQWDPININYVLPTSITPQFQRGLDTNLTLARSIERQFILGQVYNFNYNSLARANNKRHNFYLNLNGDISGNILGLATGADIQNGKEKTILGTPFSQYIRGEVDFRHYLSIGRASRQQINQLVSRIIIGAGYAWGNSTSLPFVKAFFVGGVNSIRAYRARSLGPGTYYGGNSAKVNTFLPDQPGDIKLEMNTELRFKIISIVRGALFVDAGNIWMMRNDPARPGGQFSSQFFNQLAVGSGFGLRFDISFLVLRTDVAFPIRKPYEVGGPRWTFDELKFFNKDWVFNLAIGYPF